MCINHTLRVFLPSSAVTINTETCILLGYKDAAQGFCHVTHYIRLEHLDDRDTRHLVHNHSAHISLLGIYVNEHLGYDPEKLEQCKESWMYGSDWITLRGSNGNLPSCSLHGHWGDADTQLKIVMVLFDANDLHASCLLDTTRRTNIAQLHESWRNAIQFEKNSTGFHVESFVREDESVVALISHVVYTLLAKICFHVTSSILYICDNKVLEYCSRSEYVPRPAVLQEIHSKTRRLHTTTSHHTRSTLDTIRLSNVLWNQCVDVLLGVAVMIYLGGYSTFLADTLFHWAESVAAELQSLLKWMMGVPAGLKLNQELAHCLGQFFIYHIYLWKGYLRFLAPLWTDAIQYISWSGCLGLSVQLSFMQDILSMMTLHCYCFYVYAARLYYLQVYALQSLWRLFRGKKWNPLFQRVDSSTYDVDQLFIGTILFTILLFLLPTTALFYTVFTALRLLVLSVQGTLYKMIDILHSLHIYALYLKMVTPSRISADVQLHVMEKSTHQPLYHAIQLRPVSWERLMQEIEPPHTHPHEVKDSWPTFINKILSGKLIYPWIHTTN